MFVETCRSANIASEIEVVIELFRACICCNNVETLVKQFTIQPKKAQSMSNLREAGQATKPITLSLII